jgi:hypothetical protein
MKDLFVLGGLGTWAFVSIVPWWHVMLFALLLLGGLVRTTYAQGGHASSNPGMRAATTYIRRRLWLATAMSEEDPEGFAVGRWFFAWVGRDPRGFLKIWMITPRWAKIESTSLADTKRVGNVIKTWSRFGNAKMGIHYFKHDTIRSGEPTTEQKDVMNTIRDYACRSEANGCGFTTSVYLYGPPGCGKSQVGAFLARELEASLCTKHNPLDAGDHVTNMVLKINPTRKQPLVIVCNEWDDRAKSVFRTPGKFRTKTEAPEVWDKGSYCEYMDDLANRDNVINIFTGNSTNKELDFVDEAILRDGRIDLIIQMKAVEDVAHKRKARFMRT